MMIRLDQVQALVWATLTTKRVLLLVSVSLEKPKSTESKALNFGGLSFDGPSFLVSVLGCNHIAILLLI